MSVSTTAAAAVDPILAVFQQQEAERDVRREALAALVDVVRMQERMDAVRKQLVRKPAWEAEAQSFLTDARDERGKLAGHLGLLLAEWRLAGGEITLSHPQDELPRMPPPPIVVDEPEEDEEVEAAVAPVQPASEPISEEMPSSEPPLSVEVPADEASPEPEQPALTAAQIAAFKESFLSGASSGTLLTKSPTSATWRATLAQLATEAGPPPNPMNEREHGHEIDTLETATDPTHVARWLDLPREAQRGIMSLLVTRARGLKDVASLRIDRRAQLKEIMPRFPEFASRVRPGHVNGLRVDHRPTRGSWYADAQAAWEYLQTLLPERDAPPLVSRDDSTNRPKPKKAVEREVEDEGNKREIVAEDWPGWPLTRGAHAVMVGGEPREASRERLEEVFAFGELEWISSDAGRKHDALTARVASGKVELLFVIQNLIDHKTADKLVDACRQHGVPWAMIAGYGATAIQQGIERYIERRPPGRR